MKEAMYKNQIFRNKTLIIFLGIIVLFFAIACVLYAGFARQFIKSLYENKSGGFLNKIMVMQGLQPLTSYYQRADNIFVNLFVYPALGLLIFVIAALFVDFEKIYAFFLKIFDACAKRERLFLFLICSISLLLSAVISIFILQEFPNSGDEYAYIYQAKTYLSGRVSNEPHFLQKFFSHFRIIEANGRMISQYAAGWPLVLMLALFIKMPLCLINPILGALSLLLVYLLGKRLYNGKVACISVITILISSFFLLNSASYFSHTLASVLLIAFAYFSVCFIDERKACFAVAAVILLFFALITRPFSSFLCSMPVAFYLLFKVERRKQIRLCLQFGILFFLLFLLVYNYKITGNMFIFPTRGMFYGWGISFIGLRNTLLWFMDFVGWTPAFMLLIYFVYIKDALRLSKKNIVGSIPLFLILGFLFFLGNPGNQYGPRYYYEGFPFLILFVSSKLFEEPAFLKKNLPNKILFLLFASSLISQIPVLYNHCKEERQAIWERREPYRLVEEEKINNAIIFLKTGSGKIKHMERRDLIRNEPDFSNNVLYALDLGKENLKLMQYYPQKEYYLYFLDQNSGVGRLERIKAGKEGVPPPGI